MSRLAEITRQYRGKAIPEEVIRSEEFLIALRKQMEYVLRWRREPLQPYDTDEIVQNGIIKILRVISKPSYKLGGMTGLAAKTVRNLATDFYRRKIRTAAAEQEIQREMHLRTVESATTLEESEEERKRSVLEQAIETTLTEKHREVLRLYREEIPIKEIALKLEIPEGTVHSRIFHIRKLLQKACRMRSS